MAADFKHAFRRDPDGSWVFMGVDLAAWLDEQLQ